MSVLSSHKNRPRIFYTAALAPLALIVYSYRAWPFDIAIPFYSFILLLLKKPKLFSQKEANGSQMLFGLLMIFVSFFLYFAFVPIFPDAALYGVGNYAVYILGLFLAFFNIRALREAFTPLLLIVATTSTSIVSGLVEPFLTPYIPNMASLVVAIVRSLGVRADLTFWRYPIITMYTPKGPMAVSFIWGCVGFTSVMLFSIILVIVLFEESCSLRTKVLWSIAGLVGVFFLNIVRVVMILLADYFYGYDLGAHVHYFVGYVIFITWISVFFFAFFTKQARRLRNKKAKEASVLPTAQES